MSLIRIYIDEDAGRRGLVNALRSRDVTVITALDAALSGAPDDRQLAYAIERQCVSQ